MATTSNAALQAVVDKIARMAVRKEPPDLRYDVNKDGRITSQDAFLVKAGRATLPAVEQNAAPQITSPQAGTGSTASDQGTWEWVWNQYTSLGEHGVLKNTKTGEQVLTAPRSSGDKQGIQQLAEPLTSLLNDPEFSGYAKIHSTIPLSAIDSGIQVPLDSLKDPRSYDDTWKTEFREEKQISNLMNQIAQYMNPSSSGGAWGTESGKSSGPGFGPRGFLHVMAENFYNQTGLTDLNKLGYGKINTPENAEVVRQPIYGDYEYDYYTGTYAPTVTGYQWVTPTADFETDQNGFLVAGGYRGLTSEEIKTIKNVGNGRYTADVVVGREGYYNKDTGEKVNFNGTLGGYGEGPGWTNTRLTFEGNRPVITTTGEDTSDLGTILPALAILTLPFTLGGGLAGLGTAGAAELGGLAALGEGAGAAASAFGGAGIAGLEAGALAGLGTAGAAELGGLAALGEGAGAAATVGGAEAGLGSLASNLTVGEVASVISNPTSLITKPLTESITNQIVSQLGLSGAEVTVAKTAVASVINAGTAELLGGDPAKAALATVGGTAFNAVAGPIIGDIAKDVTDSVTSALDIDLSTKAFDSITRGVTNSISTGVTTALAGGDAQDVLINSGVAFIGGALAKEKIPGTKFDETDLGELIPGYFDDDYVTGGEGTQIVVLAPRLNDIIAEPPIIIKDENVSTPEPPTDTSQVKATRESCAVDGLGFDETLEQCVEITKPTDRIEVIAPRECPPGEVDTEFGCAPIIAEPPVGPPEPPVTPEPPVGPPEPPSDRVEVTAPRECPPGQIDTGFGCEPIVAEPPVTPEPPTDRLEVTATAECPPGQVDTGFGCEPIVTKTIVAEPPVTTECAPGFHDVNGLCVADDDRPEETECPEGQVRNLDTGLCEAPKATTCPNGYVLNPTTGRCEVKVGLLALPGAFSSLFRNANSGGGAGYSPNLREKFMATRTYTPPPEDYDYFTDPYFQRFGPISYVPPENYAGAGKAEGGLMSLAKGGRTSLPPRYLDGHSDGMADQVPASIDNSRPAALSDGEFVIPADVVSHLGNGNSNAGAKVLYEMMDRIRRARTGNSKQGKQINPSKFIPR